MVSTFSDLVYSGTNIYKNPGCQGTVKGHQRVITRAPKDRSCYEHGRWFIASLSKDLLSWFGWQMPTH